jgi:hypothetical protein
VRGAPNKIPCTVNILTFTTFNPQAYGLVYTGTNMHFAGQDEHSQVPKCENFHHTDFFKFYTIKPLWVGDFRAKIEKFKF